MTTGTDIVNAAKRYAGIPYFEGNPQGTPAEGMQGFDCSGLVQRTLHDVGISVSRTTESQLADARNGTAGIDIGTDISQAQPGDIVHYPGHEEIYLGNNTEWGAHTYGVPTGSDAVGSPGPITGIVRYADSAGGSVQSAGFGLPLVPGVDYGDNYFDPGDTGGTTVNPRLLVERGATAVVQSVPWGKVALYTGGGLCILLGVMLMFNRSITDQIKGMGRERNSA
jgi:hypothetical protein